MSERKKVVAVGTMPERESSADRITHAEADVRDVTSQLRRRITDKAATMSVMGYVLDEDSWEFAINGRMVVATAVVAR